MQEQFACVMDIGEQMLLSGAEVHRVEESITRMGYALGAQRVDVFIITSSMVVTLYMDEGVSLTQTRRITSSTTDFEKLHRLNNLSRQLCQTPMTPAEIREELKTAVSGATYPAWLECLCYAAIAGAFTLFFGGDVVEMTISLVVGALVRLLSQLVETRIPNRVFVKFSAAVLVTAFAGVCLRWGWIGDVDKVIIGNIMSLIPGIGFTNALRDLFTGDSIAGLLRSIEAVLTALAIAAGYFLVAVLGGFAV